MTPAEQLQEKVADLESKLLSAHPSMPVLLREIHNQLMKDPELVTVLDEKSIGIIVSGLKKQTQTEILVTSVKNAGKAEKDKLKNLTLDDL